MKGAPRKADSAIFWMDGRLLAEADAMVPADDRALAYGDGLFESVLVAGGRPLWLSAHLSRFRRSAQALGFPDPDRLAETGGQAARDLLAERPSSRAALRITWTRGSSATGFAPSAATRVRILARLASLPAKKSSGVHAIFLPDLHAGSLAAHKTCSAMVYVEAARRARAEGVDEALLSDGEGGIAEASAANLFVWTGGKLVTPPTTLPLLPGVTRARMLRRAEAAGLAVHERALGLEDVAHAEEAFLTGSLAGVVPLLSIDGRRLGNGRLGAVTRKLAEAFLAESDR
jgi:branched-chain amino acid aminotransferase